MEEEHANKSENPAPRPTVTEVSSLPPPRMHRKVRVGLIVALVLLVALIVVGVFYYLGNVAPYESTDDAFIEGYVTYVSPRVSGPVLKLFVQDNQRVKAGDPLAEIDPKDFENLRDQARADVAAAQSRAQQARAKIIVDQAKAEQDEAAIIPAQAVAERAEADQRRYQSVQSNAVSASQSDLATSEAKAGGANVEVARDEAKAATAQLDLDRTEVETAVAEALQAQARLDQTELNLSYTKIFAPRAGRVARRTVEEGAYVQTGQELLAIVPDDMWVVANFKETQLTRIQPGQSALILIDAYPGREFKGKVESLEAGSGARFSLLPPENAVGNYVKVVQRVPVKIIFDEPLAETNLDIGPGMSVEPKVRVK